MFVCIAVPVTLSIFSLSLSYMFTQMFTGVKICCIFVSKVCCVDQSVIRFEGDFLLGLSCPSYGLLVPDYPQGIEVTICCVVFKSPAEGGAHCSESEPYGSALNLLTTAGLLWAIFSN